MPWMFYKSAQAVHNDPSPIIALIIGLVGGTLLMLFIWKKGGE